MSICFFFFVFTSLNKHRHSFCIHFQLVSIIIWLHLYTVSRSNWHRTQRQLVLRIIQFIDQNCVTGVTCSVG